MSEFNRLKQKKKKSKDYDYIKKRSKSQPVALNEIDSVDYIHFIRHMHDHSTPFKHVVLDPLCDPQMLAKVQHEVKHNMTATFKETDLFKVFQTAELGNLSVDDEVGSKMPELLKLRDKIYSEDFRKFVQNITGCKELTDRVDFSGNAYTNQCHLLCHDDVISTRCVSFIIYLTDPDEQWTVNDGGALELYGLEKSVSHPEESPDKRLTKSSSFRTLSRPSSLGQLSFEALQGSKNNSQTNCGSEQGIPAAIPSVNILPKFNSMVLFQVQPGRSYHAVQVGYVIVCYV